MINYIHAEHQHVSIVAVRLLAYGHLQFDRSKAVPTHSLRAASMAVERGHQLFVFQSINPLWSSGAEDPAAGGPERSREPAGSPQSPGGKPSLPAGRAPDAHRQPQGCSERRLHSEGHRPSGQARSNLRLTHGASFSLNRPPAQQPKDRVPPRVPSTTTGATGAGTGESWGRIVSGEETDGDQTSGWTSGWSAAGSSTWETSTRGPVGAWGGGEASGGDPEDAGRTNQDQQSL